MDFQATMTFLAGPAGVLLWAVVVSDFYRNKTEEGAFTQWKAWVKQLVVYGSFLVPCSLAYALMQLPTVAAAVAPHYPFAAALFIGGLGMAGWFKLTRPAEKLYG